MVDLMQSQEFVKVGKLFMNKNGDGTLYTAEELKDLYRKNNKELQKELQEEKPKKKVKKDDTIKETGKTNK